jgi:Spy/CpxP family protein refolding chaperone
MKKNLPLYILLIFLIIVNVFFLFNYLGRPTFKDENNSKDPIGFLAEQLEFSEAQIKQIEAINDNQHKKIIRLNDDERLLKDALFDKLSDDNAEEATIDSITTLIGLKQKEIDKMRFNHFKSIRNICNEEQKIKFKKIITDALQRGMGGENSPPPNSGDRKGPPPMDGDRQGPPPPGR